MELTLLTINTWKCDGDYYIRREILQRALKDAAAKVILCQECFRTVDGEVDTLERLSEGLGMPAYFVAARRKQRMFQGEAVDCYSGLGMLTSLPVLKESVIELPSSEEDGGRRAQLMTVGVLPGLSMLIANIHLTHLRDEALRRQQLAVILEEVRRSEASIRVIGGDWNTPAPHKMMQTVPAADCYVLGGGVEPRVSLLASREAGRPVCVDHLFTLPVSGSQTSYPSFIRAGIVLNEPDAGTGLYPSDHFGIRVTLVTETK